MKKFRIVQERKKHIEVENDLRGLGFSPILQKTHIEPYLSVNNTTRDNFDSLLKHVNLIRKDSKYKTVYHIISPASHIISHKEQAVLLFGVGLYIGKNFPKVRLYLGQFSFFHYHMLLASRQKKEANKLLHDYVIRDWLKESGRFSLEMPIQYYLKQAGFDIAVKDVRCDLTEDEIIKHYEFLTSQKEEISRKAAHHE